MNQLSNCYDKLRYPIVQTIVDNQNAQPISNKQIQFLRNKKKMQVQKGSYCVNINVKPFRHKSLPIKDRIQSEYLRNYWKKLRLDSKKIYPSEEDRLSSLTTKQIDRLIDMEKIRYVLNQNKKKVEKQRQIQGKVRTQAKRIRTYSTQQDTILPCTDAQHTKSKVTDSKDQNELKLFKSGPNKHYNVFQANFISKVNKIAIERKIVKQQAFGNDGVLYQENKNQARRQQIERQRESLKYVKQYQSNKRKKMQAQKALRQMQINQFKIDDEKSISSIASDVEEFQKQLKQSKIEPRSENKLKTRNSEFIREKNFLCTGKWFDGMSTTFLQKKKYYEEPKLITDDLDRDSVTTQQRRSSTFDISSILSPNDPFRAQNRSSFDYAQNRLKVIKNPKSFFKDSCAKTRSSLQQIGGSKSKSKGFQAITSQQMYLESQDKRLD